MVDLYCSWCEGLPQSKKALGIIRDSNEFSGIEMSNSGEEMDLVLDSGLKVSIHNPSRFFRVSLESPNFIPTIAENPILIESCKKASLPFVSFHAGQTQWYSKMMSPETIISNTRKSIRFLDRELNKKILFELSSFPIELGLGGEFEKRSGLYATSKEYMKDIVSTTNAGVLLDVSHTLNSASTKIRSNNFKGNEKDYFMDVLMSIAKDIFQMHINCPSYTKANGFRDEHLELKSSGIESKNVFECTAETIAVSPNLKMITLEIEPLVEPIKHARIMVKQAKLVRKKLNL